MENVSQVQGFTQGTVQLSLKPELTRDGPSLMALKTKFYDRISSMNKS